MEQDKSKADVVSVERQHLNDDYYDCVFDTQKITFDVDEEDYEEWWEDDNQ